MHIKDAYARNKFICFAIYPLTRSCLVSNLVLDTDYWFGGSNAGHDIPKNLLVPTRPARLLEDSNVASFACTVVTVDDGETGREFEALVPCQRVYALVMKY
jgi:hypothetical protein